MGFRIYNETTTQDVIIIGDLPNLQDTTENGLTLGVFKTVFDSNFVIKKTDVLNIYFGNLLIASGRYDYLKKGYVFTNNMQRKRGALTITDLDVVSGSLDIDTDGNNISFQTPLTRIIYSIDTINIAGKTFTGCDIEYDFEAATISVSYSAE